jgi:hypothetical protein
MANRGAPLGNQNGIKRNQMWAEALRRQVAQNPEAMRKIALKVLDMAMEGDMAAIREIGDRLDGKAVQQVIMDATIEDKTVREYTDHELTALLAQKAAERPEQRNH